MTVDTDTQRLASHWETPPTWYGRISTVDHKIIGMRYLVSALLFLLLGGIEALVMRVQLAQPNGRLVGAETYAQLFTMHGVTMMFLFALPVLSGFSNYLWPLVIGARDMALPRVNALSFWLFVGAGLFIYISLPLGLAPDAGWFNYLPLASSRYLSRSGIDFFALGLIFLGLSTTVGAINFVVTFARMRAPGMRISRTPILLWGTLTASVAVLFAIPPLTVACLFLFLDRHFGTHFYDAALGGRPLLWQQLFWMFGHPWVYIVVLPAMSMASQILPTMVRRPLVGYGLVAGSTVGVGCIGFLVWAHHMFVTGMATGGMAFFTTASMIITIPSAITVFAWVATIALGRPVMRTAFLFIAGFVVLFVIGGVTGVMTASAPFDWQLTQSYFVVGHMHYVLIGINVFPVIAGLYYWFPKFTGRLLNERVGKLSFWLMFGGFNLGFLPMHFVGMLGMPRRIYTYPAGIGWGTWNVVITVGAFLFALGVLVTLVNAYISRKHGAVAGNDPWGGATLEWSVTSPPPPQNFDAIPLIATREPLWESAEEPERSVLNGPAELLHGHTVMTTTWRHADPIGPRLMPGDTPVPFYLGVAALAMFEALLWQQGIAAGVALLAVIGSVVAWHWPRRAPLEEGAPQLHDKHPIGEWAMWLMIATEAALFASLLFAWAYLMHDLPPQATHYPPKLLVAGCNTLILLTSSMVLHWSERGARREARGRMRVGLGITLVLGVLFLSLQGWEYAHQSFAPGTDAYGSAFDIITGIHGFHVMLGLLILGFIAVAGRSEAIADSTRRLRIGALYWHFVDVVWLVIFGVLYVWPNVGGIR